MVVLMVFNYVNGYPENVRSGRQTVTAFGVLADINTGYPLLPTEMTLLTAPRTAAATAMAARHLMPKDAHTMAMIGNGAQAELQCLAFKAICGIEYVRLYDINPNATEKAMRNLANSGLTLTACNSAEGAVQGAEIIMTCTADKQYATIRTDNMVGSGVHINAIGGDCRGKAELYRDMHLRSDIFVEFPEQTRIEGEIQKLDPDHPVTELWQVITGQVAGRMSTRQITLFDSVGFATEDFSALHYVRDRLASHPHFTNLDLLADPDDPHDLFGMVLRRQACDAD